MSELFVLENFDIPKWILKEIRKGLSPLLKFDQDVPTVSKLKPSVDNILKIQKSRMELLNNGTGVGWRKEFFCIQYYLSCIVWQVLG